MIFVIFGISFTIKFKFSSDIKFENTLIAFLTARSEAFTQITALDSGGDDFINKPIKPNVLKSRINALIRRQAQSQGNEPVQKISKFGNLEIDMTRREVRLGGVVVHCKPKEFDLLLYLARHRGQALSRDTILGQVWGWEYTGNSRTVDVHMSWLREKIENDPSDPRYLATIRGVGYRLIASPNTA